MDGCISLVVGVCFRFSSQSSGLFDPLMVLACPSMMSFVVLLELVLAVFGGLVAICVGSSLLSTVSDITFSMCCRILLWVSLSWYSAIGVMLWSILV